MKRLEPFDRVFNGYTGLGWFKKDYSGIEYVPAEDYKAVTWDKVVNKYTQAPLAGGHGKYQLGHDLPRFRVVLSNGNIFIRLGTDIPEDKFKSLVEKIKTMFKLETLEQEIKEQGGTLRIEVTKHFHWDFRK